MNRIFDAYWKHETSGIYDEKITDLEANCQLLILNEANVFEVFKKRNMSIMKRLTEGDGTTVENKFGHPFTGFVDSYQLITC